jgi:cytochrome c oxidase subunit 2
VKWLHSSALFPAEASGISPYVDELYFFLLLMTIVGTTLVGIIVFGFSIRYRREKNPVATQIEGSTLLEATWTIIPLAIFLLVFVWGALLYFRIYNPPTNAMNIYVVGKQWMWKAEHPGGQHEINALHVPIGHDRGSDGADAGRLQEVAAGVDQRHEPGAERRAAVCEHGLQCLPQR